MAVGGVGKRRGYRDGVKIDGNATEDPVAFPFVHYFFLRLRAFDEDAFFVLAFALVLFIVRDF